MTTGIVLNAQRSWPRKRSDRRANCSAYVLNQPFNGFALAAAYNEVEAEANVQAVECELTAEEIAWLELAD